MVIGAAVLLNRLWSRGAFAVGLAAVVVLSMGGLKRAIDEDVFRLWRHERRYQAIARYVQDHTPANAAVISTQHSGTVRYYGGRARLVAGHRARAAGAGVPVRHG